VITSWLPTIILVIAGSTGAALAKGASVLTLGPLFQDHAVLQRDRPIAVWGTAAPGDEVTVAFAGQQTTVDADEAGRWTAQLPAVAAGGPYSLEVSANLEASHTISDILVGDVFLCSGQSNMEFSVVRSRGGLFAAGQSANERIRLMTIPHAGAPQPADEFETTPTWQRADPKSVGAFSAACYFFGREVHERHDVPVGLLNASWGGTAIEPWVGEAGLRQIDGFDTRLDLLELFARDEDAANRGFGKVWEGWWRHHDTSRGEPWTSGGAGTWTEVPGLNNWKTWGVPALENHNGMVWYRRSFTLSAAQAETPATLSLGGIDEVDQTWVNGLVIRNTFGWGAPRTYTLPAGTLRAGENVVVVNVLSTWDAGGLIGPAEAMALTLEDGTRISLGDEWHYRVVPLSMGRPPRAPWETISGLTTLYNAMIAPIGPFGLRGVAWYQGETNADAPAGYEALLGGLMASWRAQFGDDLPFLIVQLPNFGAVPTEPTESNWADLRDAQRRAAAADARAGLVVTIDIGETGDIHPSNKRDVGLRLARAARRVVYGEPVSPSGPVAARAHRDPAGVVVTFIDVEGGLETYSASEAIAFELCGAGPDSCRFVAGTVDQSRVVLPVEASPEWTPSRVRFCWGPSPLCNLSDESGLPAGPFEIAIE
jgi:sialate O-acetylesterase